MLDILLDLPVFALVLFRISGLVMTAPLLGSQSLSLRLRVAFTFALAALIFPVVHLQAPAELTWRDVAVGGVTELLIGATIGLALSTLLMAAEVGGLMVAQQAGIALGQVYDPTLGRNMGTLSQLYNIVLMFSFLLAGGHRAMISALLDTFKVIPLLHGEFNYAMLELLVGMMGSAFFVAIRLAGPVLIALILTTMAMGVLSRTMPQINILSIGFQVRILIGLSVAAISLQAMQSMLLTAVWDGMAVISDTFQLPT